MSRNALFRKVRLSRGLSQSQLADQANRFICDGNGPLEAGTISRLERGAIVRPNGRNLDALCKALDATPAQLGFEPADYAPAFPRELEGVIDGAPVGAEYIDGQRALISHLAALDGVHGGADVAPLALRSFRRGQRILGEGHYDPKVEHDLEAVTAEMGELAGWLLFDAERQEESRTVNAEALTLARIAGDTAMEWFILTNQALASIHTGRNREALRISRNMSCGNDLPTRVRALFDVRAARALGALGDGTAALETLDRARSAFEDGTTGRDPSWSWWFDERELAGHRGMVLASLGDYSDALPLLAEAVERSEGRERFRWALYIHRANLLRALLHTGSHGEAERVALDVVGMVGNVASARTEKLLKDTTAQLPTARALPSTLGDVLRHIDRQLVP